MNNREIPPKAFDGGAHELCNICGLPPIKPDASDQQRVEWFYPHRVLCITCLTAANEAMKNVQAVSI